MFRRLWYWFTRKKVVAVDITDSRRYEWISHERSHRGWE
jgi:hypothetical protein